MPELLHRDEIPMQPTIERGDRVSATVPAHLGVATLSASVKKDALDTGEALAVVSEWFNEDMSAYLKFLDEQGYAVPNLQGYEEFNSDWKLDVVDSDEGADFPVLVWKEGDEQHHLKHDLIPMPFFNQHNEDGKFYTPDVWSSKSIFPIFYKHLGNPHLLVMEPKKMLEYGFEFSTLGAEVDAENGFAEVVGTGYSSEYFDNMAKAILLRNYGVYCMNQLIEAIPEAS